MAAINKRLLGQLRPANTTAAAIYTLTKQKTTTTQSLFIANTSAGKAKFRLFFDDAGSTYDETTALEWDTELRVGETFSIEDFFVYMNKKDSTIGVRTDTANSLTFTLFGTEITQ